MSAIKDALDKVHHLSEPAKHNLDLASVGVIVGTVFSYLPDIATLLSVIWFGIRIFETRTVQKLLGRPTPKERADD